MNMLNVSIDEININIFLFCIIFYVMKQVLLGIFRKNGFAVLVPHTACIHTLTYDITSLHSWLKPVSFLFSNLRLKPEANSMLRKFKLLFLPLDFVVSLRRVLRRTLSRTMGEVRWG